MVSLPINCALTNTHPGRTYPKEGLTTRAIIRALVFKCSSDKLQKINTRTKNKHSQTRTHPNCTSRNATLRVRMNLQPPVVFREITFTTS